MIIINSMSDLRHRCEGVVTEYWEAGVDLMSVEKVRKFIKFGFARYLTLCTDLEYGEDWSEFLSEYCTTEQMSQWIEDNMEEIREEFKEEE